MDECNCTTHSLVHIIEMTTNICMTTNIRSNRDGADASHGAQEWRLKAEEDVQDPDNVTEFLRNKGPQEIQDA